MKRLRTAVLAATSVLLLVGCTSTVARPAAPVGDLAFGEWATLPPGPLSARHEAAGAFLDGRYYVVGGSSDSCPPRGDCAAPEEPPHRDGAAFDPAARRWHQIADAPVPVGGVLEMSVVAGKLYLLTGDLGRDDSPVTFLSYDPGPDRWTTLPLPPSDYPQLVAAGSRLVAIGWSDEQGPTHDAVFEPRSGSWRRLPDDPLGPSYGRGGAWLGDRLLLSAADLVDQPGADGPSLTRLAVLDQDLTRWTVLPKTELIGGHPVWVADRVVFPMTGSADGGEVGNWGRDYANGGIYDPASATWTSLPAPPPWPRSGLEGNLGSVADTTLVGGQLLDPRRRQWTRLPPNPWSGDRSSPTTVVGPDGILMWGGGQDAEPNRSDGFLLRVER